MNVNFIKDEENQERERLRQEWVEKQAKLKGRRFFFSNLFVLQSQKPKLYYYLFWLNCLFWEQRLIYKLQVLASCICGTFLNKEILSKKKTICVHHIFYIHILFFSLTAETVEITYSYWDGSGHRKKVQVSSYWNIFILYITCTIGN